VVAAKSSIEAMLLESVRGEGPRMCCCHEELCTGLR